MAKKRNDKEFGKLLLKLGIIGYFVAIYITCHLVQIDLSNISDIIENLFKHMIFHPFDILPINWEWIGIITFVYLIAVAAVEIWYEKQRNTRPGEENGSAKWNDDYDKFASKYAEPFGSKNIEQDTGWLYKDTGLPWKGEKKKRKKPDTKDDRTKSFTVAIIQLIKKRLRAFKNKLTDKWLDFTSRFHKNTVSDGENDIKQPSELQRKIYDKLCGLEDKLNMNLERYKPKVCVEERNRLEAEEKAREERMLAANVRKRTLPMSAETKKLTATLAPVNRNMILSQNVALSMDGRATRKNCNTLILGGSGAGKTRFYLKPNLMQLNCSYVITDPSGEILQTHGKFLENAGYEIKVINLTNMDQSHCYNPFNYVREDSDILVMIDVLTKNLTPPDSHSSDPFWPKSQAALLQAIAFFLYKECRPSERNFTNVMKLLRAAVIKEGSDDYKSPLDIIFEDLEKKDPNHIAVMQYSIFKQAPAKTASTILTCAQVDLAPFNLDTIANLTGIDTIDMGSIGLKPTALFCITPTAKTTYNWIISLAYTQLFETLYYIAETKCKGLRLPIHVRFLLDEFANIGQIPDFEQKLKNRTC